MTTTNVKERRFGKWYGVEKYNLAYKDTIEGNVLDLIYASKDRVFLDEGVYNNSNGDLDYSYYNEENFTPNRILLNDDEYYKLSYAIKMIFLKFDKKENQDKNYDNANKVYHIIQDIITKFRSKVKGYDLDSEDINSTIQSICYLLVYMLKDNLDKIDLESLIKMICTKIVNEMDLSINNNSRYTNKCKKLGYMWSRLSFSFANGSVRKAHINIANFKDNFSNEVVRATYLLLSYIFTTLICDEYNFNTKNDTVDTPSIIIKDAETKSEKSYNIKKNKDMINLNYNSLSKTSYKFIKDIEEVVYDTVYHFDIPSGYSKEVHEMFLDRLLLSYFKITSNYRMLQLTKFTKMSGSKTDRIYYDLNRTFYGNEYNLDFIKPLHDIEMKKIKELFDKKSKSDYDEYAHMYNEYMINLLNNISIDELDIEFRKFMIDNNL